MQNKSRFLTESAILTAISVVLIVLAGLLPTVSLAVAAIAGMMPAVIVIRYSARWGFLVYFASAILAVILAPDKAAALEYILFFGHYPMLKNYIERLRSMVLEWALKLILANILFVAFFFIVTAFFPALYDFGDNIKLLILLAANAAFIVYDVGFTRLLSFFGRRIRRL